MVDGAHMASVARFFRWLGLWITEDVWSILCAGLLMWGAMYPGIHWGLIAAGAALYVGGYIVAKKYEKRTAPAEGDT